MTRRYPWSAVGVGMISTIPPCARSFLMAIRTPPESVLCLLGRVSPGLGEGWSLGSSELSLGLLLCMI